MLLLFLLLLLLRSLCAGLALQLAIKQIDSVKFILMQSPLRPSVPPRAQTTHQTPSQASKLDSA